MLDPSIQLLNFGMIMNCSFTILHESPNPALVFQDTSRIPAFFTTFATTLPSPLAFSVVSSLSSFYICPHTVYSPNSSQSDTL